MVKSMTGFALFLEHLHHGFVCVDDAARVTKEPSCQVIVTCSVGVALVLSNTFSEENVRVWVNATNIFASVAEFVLL